TQKRTAEAVRRRYALCERSRAAFCRASAFARPFADAGLHVPPFFKGAERDAADLLTRVGRGFAHHRHLKDRAAFFVFPAEGGQVGLACFVPRRLAEQRGEAATARLDEILTLFSQNSGIEGDGEQTVLVGELR